MESCSVGNKSVSHGELKVRVLGHSFDLKCNLNTCTLDYSIQDISQGLLNELAVNIFHTL